MDAPPQALPIVVWAARLAVEADARRLGLPRPGAASFWRWRALGRGERAEREPAAGRDGEGQA